MNLREVIEKLSEFLHRPYKETWKGTLVLLEEIDPYIRIILPILQEKYNEEKVQAHRQACG